MVACHTGILFKVVEFGPLPFWSSQEVAEVTGTSPIAVGILDDDDDDDNGIVELMK